MPDTSRSHLPRHQLLRGVAWMYLEVERGLRPCDHVARYCTPDEARRIRVVNHGRAGLTGPVSPGDIARIRIDISTSDHVAASLLVRRTADRWGDLLIDLHHTHHGWQVQRIERLERLTRGRGQQPTVDGARDLDTRIRQAEHERLIIAAAQAAVERRRDALHDGRTRAARNLTIEIDRLQDRIEALDGELAILMRRATWQTLTSTPEPEVGARPCSTADRFGDRPCLPAHDSTEAMRAQAVDVNGQDPEQAAPHGLAQQDAAVVRNGKHRTSTGHRHPEREWPMLVPAPTYEMDLEL